METSKREALIVTPGSGRRYGMGPMSAAFVADGEETAGRYSISEWWLEPHTAGPGAHSHPEDDAFYVLEGTVSFMIDGIWHECPRGSFVLAPGGVIHDFQNRSDARAGMLNVSAPGNFEQHMPAIVDWFAEHPPGPA